MWRCRDRTGLKRQRCKMVSGMTHKKKATRDFESIGSVIAKVLDRRHSPTDMELTRVWELWEKIVGRAVAQNAQPSAFKGKLLLVDVVSSAWLQQLRFIKADIIIRVNEAFGKDIVDDIKFRIGTFR